MRSLVEAVQAESDRRYYERSVELIREGKWIEPQRKRGGKGHPVLSPAQRAEVLRMRREEQAPLGALADCFGVSDQAIRRVLNAAGEKALPSDKRTTRAERAAMLAGSRARRVQGVQNAANGRVG